MTFILKYRELKRLYKGYYDYLISADKALTRPQKTKLINELSRIHSKIERIEAMNFREVRKTCYHSDLKVPSRLNKKPGTLKTASFHTM